MAGSFARANREKLKLRMAIDGPSGAGKSITALRCALALSPSKKIAVIDTEHGSARKYIGEDFGEGPIEFDVCELKSFSPSSYTSLINEASRGDFEVVIVDSLSHAWEGKDGALELVNKKGGNSFTAWKDVTPMHQAMIQAILDSGCHVIVTMRSKTEYVLEADSNGKQVPRKVGMAPVQRQGMEYEFDVYLSMDWSHIGSVTKSRCRAVDGLIVAKPGADFMRPIIEWLETGETASAPVVTPGITQDQLEELAGLLNKLGIKQAVIEKSLPSKFAVRKVGELNVKQAASVISMLRVDAENKAKREAAIAEQEATAKASEPPATSEAPPTADDIPFVPDLPALSQQVAELEWLRQGIPVPPEAWSQALAKRGVTDVRKLTGAQANELILKLRAKVTPKAESQAAFDKLKEDGKRKPKLSTEKTVPAEATTPAASADSPPFEMTTASPAEADPSNATANGKATSDQVLEMLRYRDLLGISLTQWSNILAGKNVVSESQLSASDADVFLSNLEKKHRSREASAGMKAWGEKVAPDQTPAASQAKN